MGRKLIKERHQEMKISTAVLKPQPIVKVLHESSAKAVGGRAGSTRNSDGVVDVKLSLPKSLGGEGVQPGTTTPEDLFAAGYAACFGGAVDLMIKTGKLEGKSVSIDADVSIGRNDANGLGLKVQLTGTFEGLTPEQAERIMNEAHAVCPYSNATRNNVEVNLKSVVNN